MKANFAATKSWFMSNILRIIQQEKCPKCSRDKVFESNGNVLLFKIPKMKEKCSSCGYRFEKEPGYFSGAMYVSYGLCVAEMAFIFILFQITNISVEYLIYTLALFVFALWPFNFRMSRIIWMHLI